MEFIAFMSKPGGMPGRPGGMPAPPPAAPSPSAPPRRRRAGIVCGQGKHGAGEGSAETSVHVEDVSVAATDALRLAAARRYSVGGAQGGAGAHPQMRAARGAPPRCRASLPRPGRGAACPARRTGSSSHFPICALPAARSPLLQHAARAAGRGLLAGASYAGSGRKARAARTAGVLGGESAPRRIQCARRPPRTAARGRRGPQPRGPSPFDPRARRE